MPMNYAKFYLLLVLPYLYLAIIIIMELEYPLRYGYFAIMVALGLIVWDSMKSSQIEDRAMHIQKIVAVFSSALILLVLSSFWVWPAVLLVLTRIIFLVAVWVALIEKADSTEGKEIHTDRPPVVEGTSRDPKPTLRMIAITASLELNFALLASSFIFAAVFIASTILEFFAGTGLNAVGVTIAIPIGMTVASPLILGLLTNSRILKRQMPSKYEVSEFRFSDFV